MSNTRWRLTVPAIAGIVALTLGACAQGSATTTAAPAGGGSVVRYMEFSASGGHEKDLANIAKAFHAANPTITVQIDTIPFADYFTKLQTAAAARRRETRVASWIDTGAARRPSVPAVQTVPATSRESFTLNGTPCKGPVASPRASTVSAARASASARAASTST